MFGGGWPALLKEVLRSLASAAGAYFGKRAGREDDNCCDLRAVEKQLEVLHVEVRRCREAEVQWIVIVSFGTSFALLIFLVGVIVGRYCCLPDRGFRHGSARRGVLE